MGGPAIRASLERGCFGLCELPLVLQIIREPGPQDLGTKIFADRSAEFDISELVARCAIPTAVIPRTDHEMIHVACVGFFEDLVRLDRSIKVFLVPPARDVHYRHSSLLYLIDQCLVLPE